MKNTDKFCSECGANQKIESNKFTNLEIQYNKSNFQSTSTSTLKILKILILILVTVFTLLFALGTMVDSRINSFEKGSNYRWHKGSCSIFQETKVKCLNEMDYKYLCKHSDGFTYFALMELAVRNQVYSIAREASNLHKEIFWTGSNECRASITATAIIRGNSSADTTTGVVEEFHISEDGEILVASWSGI